MSLKTNNIMESTAETETESDHHHRTSPPGMGDKNTSFFDKFPPGFVFMPSDGQLVGYLRKKIDNEPLPPNRIEDVELYKFSPEFLAGTLYYFYVYIYILILVF